MGHVLQPESSNKQQAVKHTHAYSVQSVETDFYNNEALTVCILRMHYAYYS